MTSNKETFILFDLGLCFDITRAKLLTGWPYADADVLLPVAGLGRVLTNVELNYNHLPTVDLSLPLVIATIGPKRFLIDGNHRVCKALVTGKGYLSAYLLSDLESRSCANDRQLFDTVAWVLRGLVGDLG